MHGCHVKPEQFFNLIFGYHDQYNEADVDLTAPAGTVEKLGAQVPAGEIWVVTTAWAYNATRGSVYLLIDLWDGSNIQRLTAGAPVGFNGLGVKGNIVLKEGDRIRWTFLDTVLNDDLYWGAAGYKMKV